jgi:hypothetical protein
MRSTAKLIAPGKPEILDSAKENAMNFPEGLRISGQYSGVKFQPVIQIVQSNRIMRR